MKRMLRYTMHFLYFFICFFSHHLCCNTAKAESKWIVITTINSPTKALKKLVALKDWHLVVVGDKKTPKDWYLEGCHYLSPERQLELGFHITEHLPWNHYSRKNIGYLYAIKNGATVIYDTDDDTILIHNGIDYLPSEAQTMLYKTKDSVINIYAYFGQPSMWPRGYPLDKIVPTRSIAMTDTNPYVQQGLVDLDPDVDAISRLTQGSGSITFNQHIKPICLPESTFCPFNTQNTIFHQQAFWGLIIPITTKFRVCDIWRGYWVQRLLWDIGGNLCFMPPTAIQERNEHNLMHDFIDEIDLYTKAGDLVNVLRSWQSKQPNLSDRIIEVTDVMAARGFYAEKESDFIRAWIQDLYELGYSFPSIHCSAAFNNE